MNNKIYAKLVGNYLQLDCKFPLSLHNICRLSMGLEPYYFVSQGGGKSAHKTENAVIIYSASCRSKPTKTKADIFVKKKQKTLHNSCHKNSRDFVFQNQKRTIIVHS